MRETYNRRPDMFTIAGLGVEKKRRLVTFPRDAAGRGRLLHQGGTI